MPSPAATRADITRLENKVDQLISDHVKSADLKELEARLTAQINKTADSTYNREYLDTVLGNLKTELHDLKVRVGTEWARNLERLGILASIIYVVFNILHNTGH